MADDQIKQPITVKKIVFAKGVRRVNMPFHPHSSVARLLREQIESMELLYTFPKGCSKGVSFEIHIDKNPELSYISAKVYVEK